jgi:hypothetical protein
MIFLIIIIFIKQTKVDLFGMTSISLAIKNLVISSKATSYQNTYTS